MDSYFCYTKKTICNVFLLLSLLLLITSPISSQEKRYGLPHVDFYSRREYNAASQNWKITQSEHDFLYFANNDGILEYDGVRWTTYRDMGSYVARSVRSIGSKIYTGAYNELGYFSYKNSNRLEYTSLNNMGEFSIYSDFWNIHEWNEKVVFHSELALCVFRDDTLSTLIPAISRFTNSFMVNGLLLVHDESEGLMEVRGNHVFPIAGGAILKDKLITSVLPISETNIIIGTMKHGLFLWDMQSVVRWDVPINDELIEYNIYCGVDYEDSYLVYGTIQSGLVVVDKSGSMLYHIDKDKGLNNNTVLSLFVDKDGNLWGGLDNGIVRINLRSSMIFLQGYFDLGTGYAVSQLNDRWYLGTNQGLFSISDDAFTSPQKDRDDFNKILETDGQVWSLFETDNVLLCGHNRGVFEVRETGSRLITPSTVIGAWIFREIPGKENMLIAGTYNGLIILEKNSRGWRFKSRVDGFNESSRYIEWAPDGDLWISHGYKGVFRLSFDSEYSSVTEIDTFNTASYPEIGESLVISRIDRNLVITGTNGMYYVNGSGGVTRYTLLDDYFTKGYPERMIQDRYRNIWFFDSGRTGVLRLMEDGTYKRIEFPFLPLENILVPSFESVYVVDRDNILFGVEDGFAHYTVKEGSDFIAPFKVHIRSFRGRSDTVSHVLNQGIDNKSKQKIIPVYRFRDNLFDIDFAATYFREGLVEYSTYLSDYDLEASTWSNNTSRQFAKVREGYYEFTVRARNSLGVQSEPIVYAFRIMPPWYRTVLAKIGYALLTVFIVIFLIFFVNKRIEFNREREKIKQKEKFRSREELLKKETLEAEKELIRMRNEKLRSEIVFKEKELANTTMSILQKNESLLNLKKEMLRISSMDDNNEVKSQIKRLIRRIEKDIDNEDHWKVFEVHLEQVHETFLNRLLEKHPSLSSRERKLCAYIRMGMSSKEIAALTNISFRAVENNRYRLRQKLSVDSGDNLSEYIFTV
jgi:DNA-binding CsgD family transcriptional regulator